MKTFFGHCFRDEALLEEALTTPSCHMDRPGVADNQRLEFLGDAILGALAAERMDRVSGTITRSHTSFHPTSSPAFTSSYHSLSEISLKGDHPRT